MHGDLAPFDLKIERLFRLRRKERTEAYQKLQVESITENVQN